MDTATAKLVLTIPLVCVVGALAGIVWAFALYARVMADLFCFAVGSVGGRS